MHTVASPRSPEEALAMLRAAMGYLAAADAAAMAAETQAQCLRALEQLHAIETAARASVLGALASGQSHAAASGRAGAAGFSPRAWLIRETGITAGAATGHAAWVRRAAAHPQVAEALAEGHLLSEPVARSICSWTDKLPGDCRLAADAILIVAVKTGANLDDLAEVFGGIYTLSRPRRRLVPAAPTAAMNAIAI
jgi:hypothetical protein